MAGRIIKLLFILLLTGFYSCRDVAEKSFAVVPINVKVATVIQKDIKEYITFNGVLQYQKKENIRTNVTGYISALPLEIGSRIRAGQIFATVRTKEQEALQEIAKLDSSLARFSEPIHILSNASGILTELKVVVNDYVAEGDILGTISQPQSLVVRVNVPYEYEDALRLGSKCEIILQNKKTLEAAVSGILPVIDPVAQSQNYLIALPGHEELPENLNVQIRTVLRSSEDALCVPQNALQSNELLTDFWVMKVVDDTLAVKLKVQPKIQNDTLVEVVSGEIQQNDVVVTEGSYQMHDSTIVNIRQ